MRDFPVGRIKDCTRCGSGSLFDTVHSGVRHVKDYYGQESCPRFLGTWLAGFQNCSILLERG